MILFQSIRQIMLQLDDMDQRKPVPFFDYGPSVFRYLRSRFHIEDESYQNSIRGDTNVMIEKFTEGASNSFFYFSEDSRYIVKTLAKEGFLFV